ncbi:MAG: DnaD domain protein [Thermomicrobium sp.]|nr:DnaD domain protein [Thermomicrobium sp.]MDW8059249.1 DnaD domain protein [Thermomicrobium sp.]
MEGRMPLADLTCLPLELAERLVREAGDLPSIKVVLTVARLAVRQRRPAVPVVALFTDTALRLALRPHGTDREPRGEIARAIDVAVARGFLLRLRGASPTGPELEWLALATLETLALAQHDPSALLPGDVRPETAVTVERPNVFSLYEQNIGPLTPLIAQQLAEALERYPVSWVEAAIVEAVHYGRRNWRYIQRILERWATEGRDHEAHSRDQRARRLDPDKYLRGKYAPLFWNTD